MTIGKRLKALRHELRLTLDAVGGQGFVSASGWIKIENDRRAAGEKLLEKLLKWLVAARHIRAGAAPALRNELLTLKYLGSRSEFVRALAQTHARDSKLAHLLVVTPPVKPKRGRPAATGKGGAR